jgi:hypothetical protein
MIYIAILFLSAAVCYGAAAYYTSFRRRKALSALLCIQCGMAYGPKSLTRVRRLGDSRTCSDGNPETAGYLPATTFLIKCPHCGARAEFQENSRLFLSPMGEVFGCSAKQAPAKNVKDPISSAALPILVVEHEGGTKCH